MVAQIKNRADELDDTGRGHKTQFLMAFAIGALVGIGLAATWIPERRRKRLTTGIGEGYRRLRRASAAALDDVRRTSAEVASDFREELRASLDVARGEFGDMARKQLDHARETLKRERKKLRR